MYCLVKMHKKNKKAGTHVGVILSFVIFVTFLIFMMVFIQPPTKEKETKTSALNALKVNLEKETSEEITTLLVHNQVSTANCVYVDESSLNLGSTNSTVKDADEGIIESKREGGNIYFDNTGGNNFFKVIYSEEDFTSIELSDTIDCEPAVINAHTNKKEILESKIVETINFYETNYSDLKQTMNLAFDEDFSIQFEYSNKTIIGQESTGRKTNIYSSKFQILYLDKNADLKIGNFIISI